MSAALADACDEQQNIQVAAHLSERRCGVRRENQDCSVGRVFVAPQLIEQVARIHPLHHVIENDQVRWVATCRCERLEAICQHLYVKPRLRQPAAGPALEVPFLPYDEGPGRRRGTSGCAGCATPRAVTTYGP